MRDRRNTHQSTTSISSSSSAESLFITSARNSLSEKTLDYKLDDETLSEDLGKTRSRQASFLFYRLASAACILLFLVYNLWREEHLPFTSWTRSRQYLPASTTYPASAAAFQFVDSSGRQRWTVHIPDNETTSTAEYQQVCHDAKLYTKQSSSIWQRIWQSGDTSFMDVSEAQALSILPTTDTTDICESSMTFVMGNHEASFGKTMLLFWLSYGIARRDGRAFFLDDSNWAYGRFDTYFPPLARPGCKRPPTSHALPCPFQAKHIIITAETAQQTFDADLDARFSRQMSKEGDKDAAVFDLMRNGYEATFRLIGDDAAYAQARVQELRDLSDEILVGMHIRRGDQRPFELEFSQDYLPVERFTDAAKRFSTANQHLLLASDDPDIIDSSELTLAASPRRLYKSQERIQLATKLALDRTAPAKPIRQPGSAYVKHVDENAGWDGGFYAALFWSLGDTRTRTEKLLQQRSADAVVSKDALRMRQLVARGFLLDLAVLSYSDAVVCGVSSAACRMLGVMMGKEAVLDGKWINVDDGRPWSFDGRKH